jgi:hypothetical protein
MQETAQKTFEIGAAGMGPAPRCAEISPVATIPIPALGISATSIKPGSFVHLVLSSFLDLEK